MLPSLRTGTARPSIGLAEDVGVAGCSVGLGEHVDEDRVQRHVAVVRPTTST